MAQLLWCPGEPKEWTFKKIIDAINDLQLAGMTPNDVAAVAINALKATVQVVTPSSGQSIPTIGGPRNRTTIVKGSGTLNNIVFQLPTAAATQDDAGRTFRISTRRPIDSMSFSGGTVISDTTSMQTNQSVTYEEQEPGVWALIASVQ